MGDDDHASRQLSSNKLLSCSPHDARQVDEGDVERALHHRRQLHHRLECDRLLGDGGVLGEARLAPDSLDECSQFTRSKA